MSAKTEWVEEYRKCGCMNIARLRRELTGYCAKHGNSWAVRIKQQRNGRIVSTYRSVRDG